MVAMVIRSLVVLLPRPHTDPRTQASAAARRSTGRCVRVFWKISIRLACCALGFAPVTWAAANSTVSSPADTAAVATLPVGQVLLRSVRADSGQHYYVYVPRHGGQGARIFVAVHGTSRNAEEHARLLSPYAETSGVVLLAPFFPAGDFDDFQRLGRAKHGRRSDDGLESIVEEVASLTGAAATKIYLFGFSGGAQFAHRYTMAHPERVARAAVTSAGWYTFPDPGTDYPYGTRPKGLSGVTFDPSRFLQVPIAVFVGEADTTSRNMRRNAQVDRQQGVTRLDRARNWTVAMRNTANALHIEPQITFEHVPGIAHSFRQFMEDGQLGDRVFKALFQDGGKR